MDQGGTKLRIVVTLFLGGLIDIFATQVTVPLWREFHEHVIDIPDYGVASTNLALGLLDIFAFVMFVLAIGPAIVWMCLNHLFGPPRNQF